MKLAFGLIVLIAGILLLIGVSFGNLIEHILFNFNQVWPLIFVMVGLGILSKLKGLKWLSFINIILIIFFVAFLFLYQGNFTKYISEDSDFSISLSSNYSHYDLEFNLPTANITIINDENLTDTIEGNYYGRNRANEIQQERNKITFKKTFYFPLISNTRIYLRVPSDFYYNIISNTAVTKLDISLDKNLFSKIVINSVVSNINYSFKELNTGFEFDISCVVNNIEIIMPEKYTYSVDSSGLVNNESILGRLRQDRNSPDVLITSSALVNNIKLK